MFKIGDVVVLKSGGPTMTVIQYPFKTIGGNKYPEKVECEWFDEENRSKHKVFDIKEIKKYELSMYDLEK